MKVSVIIPVFNSEKYLRKCIESVINQNYVDLEIILVDDGSTDDSGLICKEYSQNYSNITMYSQTNQGASAARNLGIKNACGKYIFFLDSDDVMCKGILNSIDKYLNKNIDLLIGNVIHWNTRTNKEYIETNTNFVSNEKDIYKLCMKYAKKQYQIPWNPYQSFWKKDIIRAHNLLFDNKLTVGEDCDFFFNFVKFVNKIAVTNETFVKYRVDTVGSLIKSKTYNNIFSQLWVFNNLVIEFKNNKVLRSYFADKFVSVMFQIELLSNANDRKKCYKFISENIQNLSYIDRSIPKYFAFDNMRKIIGIKKTVRIFNTMRTITHRLKRKDL